MIANLLTRSTLAITGAVSAVGGVAINPASAARITYDFFFDIPDPNLSGPLTGRFSYDATPQVESIYNTTFDEPGVVIYQQHEVDSIEFLFQGRVYTQADSISPIKWETVRWLEQEDREPLEQLLWWETADFTFRGVSYRESGSTVFYSHGNNGPRYDSQRSLIFSQVAEQPTPVPEPSILGGLSVLGLAGLLGKKRRKAQLVD